MRQARILFARFVMREIRCAGRDARCPFSRTRACLTCATLFPCSMVPDARASYRPSSRAARLGSRSSACPYRARRRALRSVDARTARWCPSIRERGVPSTRRGGTHRTHRPDRLRRHRRCAWRGPHLLRRGRWKCASERARHRAHRGGVRRASVTRWSIRRDGAAGRTATRRGPCLRSANRISPRGPRERLRARGGRAGFPSP